MMMRFLILSLASCFMLQASNESEKVIARDTDSYRTNRRMHSSQNGNGMQDHKMYRSYTTPLRADDGIVFVEAEYLYWKPNAYIPFCTTMELTTVGSESLTPRTLMIQSNNIKLHRVNLGRQSGFRVELGFYLPPEGWTTSGQYQRITKTDSSTIVGSSRTTTNSDTPLLTPVSDTHELNAIWRTVNIESEQGNIDWAKFDTARATQHFGYQVFDWIINKTFYRRAKFALSPYFGVRGAWIRNRLDVTYIGIANNAASTGNTTIGIEDAVRLQSNYRGWGPRGGFTANWMMGYGFEMFGNSSVALLYGKNDFRSREDYLAAIAPSGTTLSNMRGTSSNAMSWRVMRTAMQMEIGLNWGMLFGNDDYYFGVKVAYEGNYWPNLIQLRRLVRDRALDTINNYEDALQTAGATMVQYFNEDLAVHGLVVGAKFDY